LEEVDDVKGVENVDINEIASDHLRYPRVIGTILEDIGWEDINTQEVERERLVIKMLDEEEERRIAEQTAANASLRAQDMTTEDGTLFLDVASGNDPESRETGSTLQNSRATRPLRTSNRAARESTLVYLEHTRRRLGGRISQVCGGRSREQVSVQRPRLPKAL
jgi:hypothetical protein